ncbi:MAG TPA: FtsX-like permease family protein [Candidatus Limnocylindria bacterium]|nr:FtsX-like permease family protein [Candidatus Limnocylindria bacterium]
MSDFGTASDVLDLAQTDEPSLALDVPAAQSRFGTVDVVRRQHLSVPGLFEPVELRQQVVPGHFTRPLVAVVEGRLPTAPDEVALAPDLATILSSAPGQDVQLGGRDLRVVALVENPADLDDAFALVTQLPGGADSASLYVDAPVGLAAGFRPPSGATAVVKTRSPGTVSLTDGAALVASSLLMLLVALVAVAAFSVIAQRRLPQLGLLAATGATRRQLGWVMTGHGALIGSVSAIVGAAVALAAWPMVARYLEPLLSYRIDTTNIPWLFVAAALALTIAAATAAASWPSRELLALPITEALSGRPHRNATTTTTRRWVAPMLLVAGLAALGLSGPVDSLTSLLLTVAGAGLVIAATVATGPLLIATAGRLGASVAVAVRLAGRDLARYRRRSGAALGALSLIIGLAVATVVTTSSAVYAADEGNLSDRQVMLRVGEIPSRGDVAPIPERSPEEVARLDAAADDVAQQLGGASVTPVDVTVIPNLDIAGAEGLPVAVLTVDEGDGFHRIVDLVYVASAQLLSRYGAPSEPGPAFLSNRTETGLMLEPIRPEPVRPVHLEGGYSSVPGTFITPAEVTRRGWGTARAGWLIEAEDPVTADEFDVVRGLAATAGITAERRAQQGNLARARDGATAIALLASLALVAMTVGLMRAETSADRRILVALGSSRRQQRDLAAATAGTLALAAIATGTGVAYLSLLAQGGDQLAQLLPVPGAHLAMLCLGLPVVAVIGSWVLARDR